MHVPGFCRRADLWLIIIFAKAGHLDSPIVPILHSCYTLKYFSHMQQESVNSSRAPEPVGPYPHARRVGDLLFLSGVGPRLRGSDRIPGVEKGAAGEIISYDIEE